MGDDVHWGGKGWNKGRVEGLINLFVDGQEMHLATVTEILQSIRQAEMSPVLSNIYQSEGGSELLDVLMKYLYVSCFVLRVFILLSLLRSVVVLF